MCPRHLSGIIFLLSGLLALDCRAVELSRDSAGSVAIIPVFSTHAGLVTLVSVNNTSSSIGKALKVRILDADGAILDSMNVYLGGYDTWTLTLAAGSAGTSVVGLPDGSCAFRGSNGSIGSAETGSEIGAQEGTIEVYEMATASLNGGSNVGPLILQNDCDGLRSRWVEGAWAANSSDQLDPPTNGTRVTASIINVGKGVLFSVPATALLQFSDIVQHTAPDASTPNLSTAHDSGTDGGLTSARTCTPWRCIEDTFASPLDAVTAALMAHELQADYLATPGLNAKTDIAVAYPTQAFYPDNSWYSFAEAVLYFAKREGSGAPAPCIGPIPTPRDFCEGPIASFTHNKSLEILSFNDTFGDFGELFPSAVLGIYREAWFQLDQFENWDTEGFARLGMETHGVNWLQSTTGNAFVGRAVIATAFVEVENGTLSGTDGVAQKANYGGAFGMSRVSRVESP